MRKSPLLIAILSSIASCKNIEDGQACIEVPADQTTCPARADVDRSKFFIPDRCGWEVNELKGDGKRETVSTQAGPVSACCYLAELVEENSNCVIGRPYFHGNRELRAPLLSDGAGSRLEGRARSGMSARAAAWAAAGAGEHASVAAFARLSLQLMRLGAPADLLRDVHQAAIDEVRHAEVCWRMAEQFGAPRVSAGEFPFADSIALDSDLSALAAAAVREGCLAETLGAHVVAVAAERAPESDVVAALRGIAQEEATHAVLSFRIVAWALRVGGTAVQSAVRAAFDEPWPKLDVEELALRTNVDVGVLRAACEEAVAHVIRPAAAELLAA